MRYFGVEEANRLIPLLNRIFERVRPWVAKAQQLAEELDALRSQGSRDAHTELLREEYGELLEQVRMELAQLHELDIEVKDANGLVDFHAQFDGRLVYLCWRFGESSVSHWHELDAGFSGRQPISDVDAFTPTYLS
jgi:hypothetical protein